MDKLYFFSKSRNVSPGKGINEYVKNSSDYKELNAIKDWRKVLSNFYVSPFEYNNKKYNTVEHAFQASKINMVSPIIARLFENDSKSKIGTGNGLAARTSRKIVVLNTKELEEWGKIKHDIMFNILTEKFAQCKHPQKVLLATNNAELWHGMARSKPAKQISLELVRKNLSTKND